MTTLTILCQTYQKSLGNNCIREFMMQSLRINAKQLRKKILVKFESKNQFGLKIGKLTNKKPVISSVATKVDNTYLF